jgi:hypothetical protein
MPALPPEAVQPSTESASPPTSPGSPRDRHGGHARP